MGRQRRSSRGVATAGIATVSAGGTARHARLVSGARRKSCVVAGCDSRPAEPPRVTRHHAELDLAVAEHVGIRSAALAVLGQEVREHVLAILARKFTRCSGRPSSLQTRRASWKSRAASQ